MLNLILSIVGLLFSTGGLLLTISAIYNNYQLKKLDYLTYKQQRSGARQAHSALSGSAEDELPSASTNPELRPDTARIRAALAADRPTRNFNFDWKNFEYGNLAAYKALANQVYQNTSQQVKQLDLGLWWSKIRTFGVSTGRKVQQQFNKLVELVLKLTQSEDFNLLNKKGKKQENLSKAAARLSYSRASKKAEQDQIVIEEDKATVGPQTSPAASKPQQVYQELEENLLNKLQQNLGDFRAWEALGNFYYDQGETQKAKEVYEYLLQHSDNFTQKARVEDRMLRQANSGLIQQT